MEKDDITFPADAKVDTLRDHFTTTYRLADNQVDLMLKSSSQSLKKSLQEFYSELEGDCDLQELQKIGHSIKGLFLNMGEHEWADVARTIEKSAADGKNLNYKKLADSITDGMKEILQIVM